MAIKNTTTINNLKVGDFFYYQGRLFLFIEDYKRGGLVFDIDKRYSFDWYDEYNANTPVLIINPDRIAILDD